MLKIASLKRPTVSVSASSSVKALSLALLFLTQFQFSDWIHCILNLRADYHVVFLDTRYWEAGVLHNNGVFSFNIWPILTLNRSAVIPFHSR